MDAMVYVTGMLQLSSSFTLLVALSRSLRSEIATLLGMKETPAATKRAWEG